METDYSTIARTSYTCLLSWLFKSIFSTYFPVKSVFISGGLDVACFAFSDSWIQRLFMNLWIIMTHRSYYYTMPSTIDLIIHHRTSLKISYRSYVGIRISMYRSGGVMVKRLEGQRRVIERSRVWFLIVELLHNHPRQVVHTLMPTCSLCHKAV